MNSASLSYMSRLVMLGVAFFGWLSAGVLMSIVQLTGQAAATDLLIRTSSLDPASVAGQILIARWFAWYQCAFLFGAAAGGLIFGWIGDRLGRARGMSLSILTFSIMSGLSSLSQTPAQLLCLWFLACLGVGGMWPTGVSLVSEAWSGLSRPMVAGVIGTSANIGLFLMASLAARVPITPTDWRWSPLVGAIPLLLGLCSLAIVPESPQWLAARDRSSAERTPRTSVWEVFQPPLLKITLLAIALATVPMIGGWGSANWMIPWADSAGLTAEPPDPFLKAHVGQARSLTGIIGSLLGGWFASVIGRRQTYFLVSLAALVIAQYTFWFVQPTDHIFLFCVAALGFFSGIYFGWLPLFLPELFPTRVRSTGAGVGFNFGRILTAITVFATGALTLWFAGDYAQIGRVTSLIFALGMAIACLTPNDRDRQSNELGLEEFPGSATVTRPR